MSQRIELFWISYFREKDIQGSFSDKLLWDAVWNQSNLKRFKDVKQFELEDHDE